MIAGMKHVDIALPKSWVAALRKKAHLESLKTGKEVLYTDLIRDAIKSVCPEIQKLHKGENHG